MNTALTIARKLRYREASPLSRFIIVLAQTATALGVAAMILTLCFVQGFQDAISQKIFGFWGQIKVQRYEPDQSILAEASPLERQVSWEEKTRQLPGVQSVMAYATKSAILEKDKSLEGVLLKGIEAQADPLLSDMFLQNGQWLSFADSLYSKDLVVAAPLAQKLRLALGDTVKVYFLSADGQERTYRKLRVSGIYKTGIEEYDKLFAFADLRLIARLNQWTHGTIGAYEIRTQDPKATATVLPEVQAGLPEKWQALSTASIYPNLFDWLTIQDLNRNVVFVIMAVVALINLVTCLLILVLERTRMIGLLKALGMPNNGLVRIFQYQATRIALKGIAWGMGVGLGLALLQQKTGWIQLDEASYYVKQAPVTLVYWQIALVGIVTAMVCHLVLFLPALLVRKINIIQALRFR